MKLKPILASLVMLGLAAPAFAAPHMSSAAASTQSQLDSMKAQLDKMEAVINQNSAGGFQQASDWTSRITISGMANLDGYWSNTTPNTRTSQHGTSSNNIALNNANLFIDALVNDWTKVHVGLVYGSNRSEVYSRDSLPSDHFDEGYITIANFSESPIFFRGGKEYLPFGVYQRYPMVVNPTQLLTETTATAAQVGFVSPMGVNASVYAFRSAYANDVNNDRPRTEGFGADLGYAMATSAYTVKLDAGYITDMRNANAIASTTAYDYSRHRVGGLALHAGFTVQNFDITGDYVKALQDFTVDNASGTTIDKVKPRVIGLDAGFTYPLMAHQSRFGVGYQHTTDGRNIGDIGLPQNRYYVDNVVNVSKWTDVGAEVYQDRGNTGRKVTVGMLRLGVKFA